METDITSKTPQEIAVESAEKELIELERLHNDCRTLKYTYPKEKEKWDRHKELIRGIINEKSSALLELRNHYSPPQPVDAREKYVHQVEEECAALRKIIEQQNLQLELIKNQEKNEPQSDKLKK